MMNVRQLPVGKRMSLERRPRPIPPGNGMSDRYGDAFSREEWPAYRTRQRVELLHLLTIRPDDYLTVDTLLVLGEAAGFESTRQARHSQLRKLENIGWVERRGSNVRSNAHGFRLTARALASVELYVNS